MMVGLATVLAAMFPIYPLNIDYTAPNVSSLLERNYTQQQWEAINVNLSQPASAAVPLHVSEYNCFRFKLFPIHPMQ